MDNIGSIGNVGNVGNIGNIGDICNIANIGVIGNTGNKVYLRKVPEGCLEFFFESFSGEYFSRMVF